MNQTKSRDQPEITKHPVECSSCGGSIDYADREDGTKIALCNGECGGWSVIRNE